MNMNIFAYAKLASSYLNLVVHLHLKDTINHLGWVKVIQQH